MEARHSRLGDVLESVHTFRYTDGFIETGIIARCFAIIFVHYRRHRPFRFLRGLSLGRERAEASYFVANEEQWTPGQKLEESGRTGHFVRDCKEQWVRL